MHRPQQQVQVPHPCLACMAMVTDTLTLCFAVKPCAGQHRQCARSSSSMLRRSARPKHRPLTTRHRKHSKMGLPLTRQLLLGCQADQLGHHKVAVPAQGMRRQTNVRDVAAAGVGTRARAGQQPAGMRSCSNSREGCLLLTVRGCNQARGLMRSGSNTIFACQSLRRAAGQRTKLTGSCSAPAAWAPAPSGWPPALRKMS